MRIRLTVFFFLFVHILYAQDMNLAELEAKSFDQLIELFDDRITDTVSATLIARQYIKKARAIADSTKMARGYQRLAFVANKANAIKYLDTTIALSQNSKHPNFPAVGYLFKSYYLYNVEKYEESLQNAITGYQFAKQKQNIDQQITALHQINGVNELWGDYEKALETELLTKELLFQNKNSELFNDNYIASLEGIGNCYVRLRKPDSALVYYKKGIEASLKNDDSITYHAFVSKAGTALYVKGDYNAALDSLTKGHAYKEYFINSYETYYNYYMGSIYFQQGVTDKGVVYFKKVDSIYGQKSVLYPELPVVYDKLANYYAGKGNKELQLDYMQKLVLVVKLINIKRVYIKDKIAEEYEIPKLLEEKDALIEGLEAKNYASQKKVWGIGGVLLLALIALLYYVRRQRTFQKRFEQLMEQNKTEVPKEKQPQANETESIDISEDIVSEILSELERFESQKDFLSSEIKLTQLAKACNTNSTYLSKVINYYKGKNFSSYINELRVAYAFEELRDNPTFRKYTIKAVAMDCGFKSAESFSKAFYKKYGIYPSYYSKQLDQKRE